MKRVVFITRSINSEAINGRGVNTSSAFFELGLIRAMNEMADLRVIHLGGNEKKTTFDDIFEYQSINFKTAFGFVKLGIEIIREKKYSNVSILTTGYYPLQVIAILFAAKVINAKTFSYVYDTHRQATSKMTFIKKFFANIYFEIGFMFVKMFTGLLVLNDSFIKKRSITTRYLKTKVGICLNENKKKYFVKNRCRNDKKKIVVFAGTINVENGIDLIIPFVKKNKQKNFELHVYGDGDCVSKINELSAFDSRVKYFGRVTDEVLQERLRFADILLNLRNPCGISVDYSFPSKLINFMATGIPVVTNRFPGLNHEYDNCLYFFDYYNEKSFTETMFFLLESELSEIVSLSAFNFVKKNNDWKKISKEVLNFIS